MSKSLALILAGSFCLAATSAPAQEDAADAALNKGFKTEEAAAGSNDDGSAPDAISGPASEPKPKSAAKPSQQAPVGQAPASFTQRPGLGEAPKTAGTGAGIACGDSVPKLANVIKKKFDFAKTAAGPVNDWDVAPNEAISYSFKTPASGTGKIFITMGHIGRPVPHLATISETACDFDVAKARKASAGGGGQNYCYAWGPSEGGLMFAIAPSKLNGCVLKPNADYYFNIRSLSNPGQGEARDACADELPFFRSRPDLPRLCGGIWQLRAYGG